MSAPPPSHYIELLAEAKVWLEAHTDPLTPAPLAFEEGADMDAVRFVLRTLHVERGWTFVADASDGYAIWAYAPGAFIPPDDLARQFDQLD